MKESNSKQAPNLSAAIPDTGFDMGHRIGYSNQLPEFTLSNTKNEPLFVIRSRSFGNMGKFDASGNPMPGDPISQGINRYWVDVLKRYLTSALRSDSPVLTADIITYYALVERLYALLSTPLFLQYLYEEFPWGTLRGSEVDDGVVPPAFEKLADDWGLHDGRFEELYMKYLHALAHQAIIPGVPSIIDRGCAAYFLTNSDRTLRIDLYEFDLYAETGNIISTLLELDTIITALNTVTMNNVRNFVLNFLPYRAGFPQPEFLGVSPIHAQSWWNQSFFQQDVWEDDYASTYAPRKSQCVCAVYDDTAGVGQNALYPGEDFLPATMDDEASLVELAFMTMFYGDDYNSGTSRWHIVCPTYFLDRGTYLFMDDLTVEYVNVNEFLVTQAVNLNTNPVEMMRYVELLRMRFQMNFNTNLSTIWTDGAMHSEMSRTVIPGPQMLELFSLMGAMNCGVKWLNYLSAKTSGTFPKGIHYTMEAAFRGE